MRVKVCSTGLLSRVLKMSSNKVQRFLRMSRRHLGWTSLVFLAAALVMSRACTSAKCLNEGSRIFYNTNHTPAWSDADVLVGGDTMAEILRDSDRISCRLSVINGDTDRGAVYRTFPNATRVSVEEMMEIVERCGKAEEYQETRSWSAKQLSMYPGTLWCGPGDYASNYSHLGESKELDRCCRNHDFCPVKIYAGQTRFGLKPPFLQAALHCDCERAFDECLREAENAGEDSTSIRRYYFNWYAPPCLSQDSEEAYVLVSFETYNKSRGAFPR